MLAPGSSLSSPEDQLEKAVFETVRSDLADLKSRGQNQREELAIDGESAEPDELETIGVRSPSFDQPTSSSDLPSSMNRSSTTSFSPLTSLQFTKPSSTNEEEDGLFPLSYRSSSLGAPLASGLVLTESTQFRL